MSIQQMLTCICVYVMSFQLGLSNEAVDLLPVPLPLSLPLHLLLYLQLTCRILWHWTGLFSSWAIIRRRRAVTVTAIITVTLDTYVCNWRVEYYGLGLGCFLAELSTGVFELPLPVSLPLFWHSCLWLTCRMLWHWTGLFSGWTIGWWWRTETGPRLFSVTATSTATRVAITTITAAVTVTIAIPWVLFIWSENRASH